MTSTPTDKTFRAYAELYAPGSAAATTKFFARGQQTITLTEPGTYMLYVHDYSYNTRGSFTIGLEGINPISPAPASLKLGGILNGSIDQALDVDELKFNGLAGQSIQLATTSTVKDKSFRAYYSFFAPSGAPMGSFFSGSPRLFNLPEDGTYMVYVRDYANSVRGNYSVGLEGINPFSPDAKNLPSGIARSGSIVSAIGVDEYLLTLNKNDQVNLTLTSTAVNNGFTARAEIFGPDGASNGTFSASTRKFVAPSSGVYMIQVHDYSYARNGKYTLAANWLSKSLGGITGILFRDANGNGKMDAADKGIADATVFVDANSNGRLDAGEKTVKTDPDGIYAFTRLATKKYLLRVLQPDGFRAPSPTSGRSVKLAAGQNIGGINFSSVPIV